MGIRGGANLHCSLNVNAISCGGGIGEAYARGIAAQGARVAIAEIQKDAGLPLSRLGQPSDMVDTCLFLLSDASSWITGQVINVDGAQIRRP